MLGVSFGDRQQFFGHPFFENLIFGFGNRFPAVSPLFRGIIFTTRLLYVILDLLEADQDPLCNIIPVVVLYATENYRKTRCPVFLGRDIVILGYRQIRRCGQFLSAEFAQYLVLDLGIGSIRISLSHFESAPEDVGNCRLVSHTDQPQINIGAVQTFNTPPFRMKRVIYQLHLLLGLAVAIPVLAWSFSGFMYALPNTVEGGTIEKIDPYRVKITPAEAITKANEVAGRSLPTTALTLLMKDGKPQYQSIGGLGADSIFVDAETGEASFSKPPTWKTRFFREAHFYFFAGEWQVTLLLIFSGLASLSAMSGIYLSFSYWSRRFTRSAARGDKQSVDNFSVAENHHND